MGVFLLFYLALMMVTTETNKADIKTNAEFIITLTWDTTDDVDLWVENPLGDRLYFRRKEIRMAHLDRDDLGDVNDSVILPNGTRIEYDYNQEIATIRGNIAGQWVVNAHMYDKDDPSNVPANVEVKIEKLNPMVTTVAYKKIKMTKKWQEVTIARFTLTDSGTVIKVSELPKKLIRDSNQSGRIDRHSEDEDIRSYSSTDPTDYPDALVGQGADIERGDFP